MKTFDVMKKNLFHINREIQDLFEVAKELPAISRLPFDEWDSTCKSIVEQVDEGILRIAVVGAIKSGKSTFVNSFLGGDYLKRGAGVVTSIVTKVRRGPTLKAILDFKTWDDVNADMRQAMELLPSFDRRSGDVQFDIRREGDRKELERTLQKLGSEHIIVQEQLDANRVLLMSYLKGYDRAQQIVSVDAGTRTFEGPEFVRHKDFVGDDSLAVYLRDLELRVPSTDTFYDNIEIADCQGSDSPNPIHLSMTQEYLVRTHLIIYLLSSRTGVRQADIKFLSMIKKMGLMENIFFVINCDFNEHETIEGLTRLVDRIVEEISVLKLDPTIFAISTLYDLLRKMENISPRDRARLEQWQGEEAYVRYSDKERERFESEFREKLTRDRFTLLLKNPLERFAIMMASLNDWAGVNSDILMRDAKDAGAVYEKMKHARSQVNELKPVIKDTMGGASQKTKSEVGKDVNGFMDARFGTVMNTIQGFVRKYEPDYERNESDIEGMGFSTALYMLFQDFKHDLDLFMTGTVNPRLIQFIRQEEKKIFDSLNKTSSSYDALVRDTLQRYKETTQSLGISSAAYALEAREALNIEDLRKRTGINAPPLVSPLRYTAKIRAEAVVRLGFYNAIKIVKRLFGRKVQNRKEVGILALRDGVKRLKQETERSMIFHLGDYKENLKFQYLFKFVDMVSNTLMDNLFDRFRVFTMDISEMAGLIDRDQAEKESILAVLNSVENRSQQILEHVIHLKADMG
ncbi:MAG TPA: dynamin family protein [Syntrophales bacterium]|nr:dynamin family protein [Syntrophales bacterium]